MSGVHDGLGMVMLYWVQVWADEGNPTIIWLCGHGRCVTETCDFVTRPLRGRSSVVKVSLYRTGDVCLSVDQHANARLIDSVALR